MPIDALALDAPRHDGNPVDIAREIYHRILARLIANRIYWLQWMVMAAAAFVALIGTAAPLIPRPGLWIGFFLAGAAAIIAAAPFMPRFYNFRTHQEECKGIVRRCFLRSIDEEVPPDLADTLRHGWLTADGRPLSAEIAESDARFLAARQRSVWWLVSAAAFGFALASIAGMPFGWLIVGGLILAKFWMDRSPLIERALELQTQQAVEGAAFAASGGLPWSTIALKARDRQIAESLRDQSPLIRLGETTGLLAARGDMYAPSASLPFCLSVLDLHQHLLITGGVGTGKTSGVLRPIAKQICAIKDPPDLQNSDDTRRIGLVVIDGKGELPAEMADMKEIKIISPKDITLSLSGNLDPSELIDTIADIFGREMKERFWVDSAADLLRNAAIIGQAVGTKETRSLNGIAALAFNRTIREHAINSLEDKRVDNDPFLKAAILFFINWNDEEDRKEARTHSSIVAVARSWVATLTAHPHLHAWADAVPEEDSVDITEPLFGGRIGFLIPAWEYGAAAPAVTALIKARIYAEIKARATGGGWPPGSTSVVFLIDEAQDVTTKEDADMLAIGRSLGLAVIAATQTVEGVTERLGQEAGAKWLATFGNVIALANRSRATDEFVAARAGSIWKPSVQRIQGLPVRDGITAAATSGAFAAGVRQTGIRRAGEDIHGRALKKIWQSLKDLTVGAVPELKSDSALGTAPVIDPAELAALTAEPDTALALCTRARVLRRDLIRLSPSYPEKTAGRQRELEDWNLV